MKKMLLVLGVAAAAMTSCTSDELIEVNQSSLIKFEPFVNKGTRSVTDTDGNISKFYVYGCHTEADVVSDFVNVPVTKSNSEWGYYTGDGDDEENYRYWTSAQYFFGAYATKNGSDILTDGTEVAFDKTYNKLTFTDFTVNDDNDLVADVITFQQTSFETPQPVQFNFRHLLSKIQFSFKNTHSVDGTTMDITDLQIDKCRVMGTCVVTATEATWSELAADGNDGTNTEEGTRVLALQDVTTSGIAKNNTYVNNTLVVPGEIQDDYKVSFKVTFKNAQGQTIGVRTYADNNAIVLNRNAVNQWKPGYVYNYTANLSLDLVPIKFEVSVKDWNSDLDGDGAADDDIPVIQ